MLIAVGAILSNGDKPSNAEPSGDPQRQYSESGLPFAAFPADIQSPGTSNYQELCRHAQSAEDRDLCQQWRMAEGAESLVMWAKKQFQITTIEVIALVLTICVTAIAAIAATRAARAANASVAVARETAVRQLRAYISPLKPSLELREDGIAVGHVEFKNVGQTPAYHVTCWATIGGHSYPLIEPLPNIPVIPDRSSRIPLGPGRGLTVTVEFSNPTTPQQQEIFAQGIGAIYLYGHVKYRDVFGNPRTVEFRFMYSGPWGGKRDMSVCQEGNEAD